MNHSYYERAADVNGYFTVLMSINNQTPAHFHNSTEILAVIKGKERVVINGTECVLSAGEFAVSNRFDVHYYDCVESSEVAVVMLSDEYTSHFREVFDTGFASFLPRSESSDEILGLIQTLYEKQKENRLIVSGYVDVLLGTLKRAYPHAQRFGRPSGNRFADILAYIEENFAKDISEKTVASQFGYSVNYFSALFNRFAGMHFKDYVNRLRVTRAGEMIDDGTKVCEAIFACGFDSPNSYYRAKRRCKPENA